MIAPLATAGVVAALLTAGAGQGGGITDAHAENKTIVVEGRRGTAPRTTLPSNQPEIEYEFVRRPVGACGTRTWEETLVSNPCAHDPDDFSVIRQCDDGSMAQHPLFRRALDAADAPAGPWELVDNGGCPEDPAADVILTVEEFRRLPLEAADPVVQPFDGRALVNMGIAMHADPTPQTFTTTVVGTPVQVRATAVQYTWDFGDGTWPVTTRLPGGPWPNHAALSPYPEPGQYEIRLTTSWRGEYRVNGAGPWQTVTGTATTTSGPVAISVETAPARLVSEF